MVGIADSVLIREIPLFRVSFIERLHCIGACSAPWAYGCTHTHTHIKVAVGSLAGGYQDFCSLATI